MLDQNIAEAMQRILAKSDERFPITLAIKGLLDAGLGTKRGKSAYFAAKDKDEMRAWLKAKGFSVEQTELSGLTRAEVLAVTPLEKSGSESVKRNRISIKALAGQPLMIGADKFMLPAESHLDIEWSAVADKLGHQCVIVVENYENFNRIHETSFNLPEAYRSALVIYRGDPNESRFDNVLKFLNYINLPVLAFMDADPAGIAIACQLPRLVGMVLPPLDVLDAQLGAANTARKDLFHHQVPVYGNALDKLEASHPCRPAWDLVSKHAAGVVQERWITGCTCTI